MGEIIAWGNLCRPMRIYGGFLQHTYYCSEISKFYKQQRTQKGEIKTGMFHRVNVLGSWGMGKNMA